MATTEDQRLKAVISRVEYMALDATKLIEKIQKEEDELQTVGALQDKLAYIRHQFETVQDFHYKLMAQASPQQQEEMEYFKNNKWQGIHESFELLIGLLESKLNMGYKSQEERSIPQPIHSSTPHQESNTNQSHYGDMTFLKLPKLEIPSFDGTYDSWQNFKDLFLTSVDQNAALSNVIKMQHLKSLVKGDAANVISTLQITETNYTLAWNALKERYDNKRAQITHHFNKLASIPTVNQDSLIKLKQMRDTIQVSLGSLQVLGYNTDQWGPCLLHQMVQKFSLDLRREWEKALQGTTEYPQFKTFEKFLTDQINILDNLNLQKENDKGETSAPKKPKSTLNTTVSTSKGKCAYCDKDHTIYQCTAFQALNPQQRQKATRDKGLCGNCLGRKHYVKECQSTNTCRTCKKRHHTLLHRDFPPKKQPTEKKDKTNKPGKSTVTSEQEDESDKDKSLTNTHVAVPTNNEVMLATALVTVYTPTGHSAIARALIDSGSESSFVSEALVQTLKMKKVKTSVSINGLQGTVNSSPKSAVSFEIANTKTSTPRYAVYAYVLQTITAYQPKAINLKEFPDLKDLVLADPAPWDSRKIDLLLGADVMGQFLESGVIHLKNSQVIAQASTLGWILSGPVNGNKPAQSVTTLHTSMDLPALLQRFWEIEESPGKPPVSEEDEFCEKLFRETTTRDAAGRYSVHLPIIPGRSVDELGDSRHIAIAAWAREETRLDKLSEEKPNVREEYDAFMIEYEKLGHMTEISADNLRTNRYVFLPHHAVLRPGSITTSLRVVFNASSKTRGGVTLNDILCVGPKLQNETANVINNWRIPVYVYKADISKMYRQIEVHPSFRDLQCIVWQKKGEPGPKFYKLNTVTYGTRPAPYLANRVIKAVIEDHGSEYPLAVEPLDKCTYVDDTIFGADEKAEAREIRDQVETALKRGCLELRKWSSNCEDLLPAITEGQDEFYIEPDSNSSSKVLGLVWSTKTDEFSFKVAEIDNSVITKRTILSNIAKLFDPLGWLSPFVVRAKILMQSLWLVKAGWDDSDLPEQTQTEWIELCEEMQQLSKLTIPRFVGPGPQPAKVKLVGFSDASKRAYSAVVFIYVEYQNGETKSHLLRAKTKVAPVKTQSIPRLELCATVELTKLITTVRDNWLGKIDEICCYTDSQIVLDWFARHASSWHTFVANRVSLVQTTLPEVKWRHVSTKKNPADLNSRGMKVEDLLESGLWWNGPNLTDLEQCTLTEEEEKEKQQEVEKEACHLVTSLHESIVPQLPQYLTHHSSWLKLTRMLAFWFKYLSILKERAEKNAPREPRHELWAKHQFRIQLQTNRVPWHTYVVTREHVIEAQNHIYKRVQEYGFKPEMDRLKRHLPVSKGSSLHQLVPFLDENGVMRQKGRLVNSSLPYSQKHPVMLPPSRVTDMLITHFHLRSMHAGVQQTLALIRERYFIVHCRNRAKYLIDKCVTCARYRAQLMTQQMSPLPAARSSESRPFSHTGVDYIGPLLMKNGSAKCKNSHKIWVAIFVCFSTRAIHLEICNDYSSKTFLKMFKCFTSRRGVPSDLYSDQATTFKGAYAEMKRAFKAVTQDPDVLNTLASEQIVWHMIPPHAGHWGGLWEAGVRSFKYHFRRALGHFIPTRDELHSILCQIEGCLNSRPLTQVRDDASEGPVITPGHSLIGANILSIPEPSLLDEDEKLLNRWQTTTRIVQAFWKRWRQEYLHTLQRRTKWENEKENIKVGDIVLLQDPNRPPCDWGMAKVIQVIPSKDNLVRQVKIQTKKSKLVRPITALCRLPVE